MRRFMWWIIIIAVLAVIFVFPPRKFHLFSEVHGVVLRGGKPLAGAEVERTYNWGWKDETKAEKTVTDGEGKFSFPSAVGFARLASWLPHEPVVTQHIYIRENDTEYDAWGHAKHNYNENGELQGRKIDLECKLETEPEFRGRDDSGIGGYYGICTLKK